MSRVTAPSPRKPSRRAELGLLLLSLAVGLVLAEVAIGYLVRLRDVGPSFTHYDPELGKRLKPNFSTTRWTPEFTMRITTNRFGFRGPQTDALPKGAIMFLGDSFTMGYGVNDGQEYPAIVTARLNQDLGSAAPPSINTGIGDSGNGRWIKLLRTLAVDVEPRLVVMQVLDNDFYDNVSERLFDVGPEGRLRELPVPTPGWSRRLQALIDAVPGLASTNLIGLLRQLRWPGGTQPSAPVEQQNEDRLTLLLIEQAVLICKERGWNMLALVVGLEGGRKRAVTAIFEKHGVRIVGMETKTERPDLYYKVDGHWNAAGHVLAADRLTPAIRLMTAGGR